MAATFGGMDLGETSAASRVVYALVGLSALWWAARLPALPGGRSRGRQGSVAA